MSDLMAPPSVCMSLFVCANEKLRICDRQVCHDESSESHQLKMPVQPFYLYILLVFRIN